MKGDFVALYLYQNGTGVYQAPQASWTTQQRINNDNYLSYYEAVFETRIWEPKMYYYPFSQTEVNKGFLVQNPQW
jgi:hypothetical protein